MFLDFLVLVCVKLERFHSHRALKKKKKINGSLLHDKHLLLLNIFFFMWILKLIFV